MSDKKYALFRKPHISRNEHVVASALVESTESERERYLGHLQGIVMINPTGFYAERLGGADYDGDIVKIVEDEIYIKGAEIGNELELLKIPTVKSKQKKPTVENCFNTVIDTFSNRVGNISNYAFKNGIMAYNSDNTMSDEERAKYEMNVRELAILTGLEIDSAKNGKKPRLDFKKYAVDMKNRDIDFLDLKQKIKNNEKTNITVKEIGNADSNIDILVKEFEKLKNLKSVFEKNIKDMPIFEQYNDNPISLDLKNKIIALILACKAVTKNINLKIFYSQNEEEDNNEIQIRKILLETHSFDYVEKNISSYRDVFLNICDNDILRIFKKRISDLNWAFTSQENRPSIFEKIIDGYKEYFESTEKYERFFDFRKKGYNLLYYSISYASNKFFKEQCLKNDVDSDKIEKSRKKLKMAIEKFCDDTVSSENYISDFVDFINENKEIIDFKKIFAKNTDVSERLSWLKEKIKTDNTDLYNMLVSGLNEKVPFIFKVIDYYKEYSAVVDEIGKEYIRCRQDYYKKLMKCVPAEDRFTKSHIAEVYRAFRNEMIELCGSADEAIKILIPLARKYDENQKLLWNTFPEEVYQYLKKSNLKVPLRSDNGSFIYEIQKYIVDEKLEGENL